MPEPEEKKENPKQQSSLSLGDRLQFMVDRLGSLVGHDPSSVVEKKATIMLPNKFERSSMQIPLFAPDLIGIRPRGSGQRQMVEVITAL